jgi:hypothetical protein
VQHKLAKSKYICTILVYNLHLINYSLNLLTAKITEISSIFQPSTCNLYIDKAVIWYFWRWRRAINSSLGKLILRDLHWLIISKNYWVVPLTWTINGPLFYNEMSKEMLARYFILKTILLFKFHSIVAFINVYCHFFRIHCSQNNKQFKVDVSFKFFV